VVINYALVVLEKYTLAVLGFVPFRNMYGLAMISSAKEVIGWSVALATCSASCFSQQ
jgi:hypothetical protein